MQLLVDSFVPADRRDSPRLEGLATLVPVLGKLDARQQERVLELLTLSLRGGFDRSRNTVPTLVSFSRLRPDARERIVTALLRSLEGRSAMPTESVLAIIAEFTGTPVSRQGLYNLLKWPTLSTVVYTDVVNELARREKTPPDSLLRPVAPAYRFAYLPTPAFNEPATEPDRWALARWEAARTLNLAPLQTAGRVHACRPLAFAEHVELIAGCVNRYWRDSSAICGTSPCSRPPSGRGTSGPARR